MNLLSLIQVFLEYFTILNTAISLSEKSPTFYLNDITAEKTILFEILFCPIKEIVLRPYVIQNLQLKLQFTLTTKLQFQVKSSSLVSCAKPLAEKQANQPNRE